MEKSLGKKLRRVFSDFEKEKIEYCVLKNYTNFEENEDVDLLVLEHTALDKVLERNQFLKIKQGPLAVREEFECQNGKHYLHIKIGGITYGGARIGNGATLLKRKKKRGYFYTLSETDEIVHLILHAIINKREFKQKYITQIKRLRKEIKEEEIQKELARELNEKLARKIMQGLKREDYEGILLLRKNALMRLFTLKRLLTYFARGIIRRTINLIKPSSINK